jgi:5-methylthioadenosine/S-adenosylhomocysteine deaminase
MTICIQNGSVITLAGATYDPGFVLIEGDRIAQVGPMDALADQPPVLGATVIEARNMAVLPGLVNAHTHLSQTFVKGLGDSKTLLDWLKGVIWPFQAALTPDEVYLATLLGLVENLRCGVTALTEHHKITNSPAHSDAVLRAAAEVGLRFTLAYGWVDLGNSAQPAADILAELHRLHGRYHGKQDGRLRVAIGPMAPWRCSNALIQQTYALAELWDVSFHLHTAETREEVDLLVSRENLRHVEWLDALGVLGPRTQLVHSVWLSDHELDLIERSGARVIHCATSNMYLASGIAPVPAMRQRHIPIALGADGQGSNNNQDMLELLKVTALLAKIGAMDPTVIPVADLLQMATVQGAHAVGLPNGGVLRAGAPADLILVDLDNARCQPAHDAAATLVYNASGADVDTVIVGGQVLMRDKRLIGIDEKALFEECRGAARALLRRAGVPLPG